MQTGAVRNCLRRMVMRVGQERLGEDVLANIIDRLRDADRDDEVAAAWVGVDLLRHVYQALHRSRFRWTPD